MLIFEKSRPGRGCDLLPASDVEIYLPEEKDKREQPLHLPELSEGELSRHYTELAKKSHGVNDGFYPLGSICRIYSQWGRGKWNFPRPCWLFFVSPCVRKVLPVTSPADYREIRLPKLLTADIFIPNW